MLVLELDLKRYTNDGIVLLSVSKSAGVVKELKRYACLPEQLNY